jgi:2-dehydropantoate 2-reductase
MTLDRPKIAVMGAGAVGCYYGGMLARAGVEVALIGRAQHVDAIARNGLLLETLRFKESVPMTASTDPAEARDAALVLFCVKSTDTEEAANAIAPHVAREAALMSLQNGVDNVERVAAATSRTVIPAVVYVAAAMIGPGHVRHSGRGDLIIGTPAGAAGMQELLESIAALFAKAEVAVRISDNVDGELWVKLIMNCAYNALSALTRSNYGRLIPATEARGVMRDAVEEIERIAAAKGIRIPLEDTIETVYALAEAMPEATSSTAQDIARGHRTEIDHLNGYIARQGEALGIPAPVNRTLHRLVKLLEAAAVAKRP